jgi:hypothetical protein
VGPDPRRPQETCQASPATGPHPSTSQWEDRYGREQAVAGRVSDDTWPDQLTEVLDAFTYVNWAANR